MQTATALDILLVDDDGPLRDMLTRSFEREGHRVTAVADGDAALKAAGDQPFDVVLLDVALGEGPTGHDVARLLRRRRDVVPIIMLTALDSEADAVQGLEAGADDYVTKPFGLAELRSRIRAVLRRAQGRVVEGNFAVGPVSLDRELRRVEVDGGAVRLTFSEFELLACLMGRPGPRLQPPGAAARDLGRQRLPRPARDRRPHPPPAREARGDARAAEPDPHRARAPATASARHETAPAPASAACAAGCCWRSCSPAPSRSRPRRPSCSARCSSACATRAPRACAPPCSPRARASRRRSRAAAASTARSRCSSEAFELSDQTAGRVLVTDLALTPASDGGVAARASSPTPRAGRRRARPSSPRCGRSTARRPCSDVRGDDARHRRPAVPRRRRRRRRGRRAARLTEVGNAVKEVRNALLAAAGVGLAVAVALAFLLASTLLRRLGRLRAAALRISAEGPDVVDAARRPATTRSATSPARSRACRRSCAARSRRGARSWRPRRTSCARR